MMNLVHVQAYAFNAQHLDPFSLCATDVDLTTMSA